MTTSYPMLSSQEELLRQLGLSHLPQAERDEMLSGIGDVIFRGVIRRAWNVLDIQKQDELLALLEASSANPGNEDSYKGIHTFLELHVPEFERFIAQEVELFKNTQEQIYGEITS